MAELTLEQRRAIALAKARQAQAAAQIAPPQEQEMTGAEQMRARGISSPDPAAANAAADPRSGVTQALDAGLNFSGGAFRGLTGMLGMPSDLFTFGYNKGMSAVGGIDQIDSPLGAEAIRGAMAPNLQPPMPRNETERRAGVLGEYVGPGLAVGGAGGLGGLATAGATDTAAGLAAGEVRERGGGPMVEIAAALAAGGAPLTLANKVSKAGQTRRAIDAVPEIDELKASAGALYDQGAQTGNTAARGYTQQLSDGITAIARQEGMISPTGRMADTYPKVSTAMKMVGDYAGQKMTPEQMRQVRRVLQDAAQSADGAEARIGTKMLKAFDQFVDPLVPEFKQADKLYSRAMRGKEIDDAIAKAGTRPQTAEKALSNEFANLQRAEIGGNVSFPPELSEAVAKAAQGGPTRQLAALLSKAAPTGIVSGGLGFGVPAAVAASVLGPVGGLAAGTAASGTGHLAKLLANRLAKGDARVASAIARNGGPLEAAKTPEEVRAAIAALLASMSAAGQQPTQ